MKESERKERKRKEKQWKMRWLFNCLVGEKMRGKKIKTFLFSCLVEEKLRGNKKYIYEMT